MKIDRPYGYGQVQFIVAHPPPDEALLQRLKTSFSGDQPDDYYRGLLTGYANALSLIQQFRPDYLPYLVALVADHIVSKEIQTQ